MKKIVILIIVSFITNSIFADFRTDTEFMLHSENLFSFFAESLDYEAESYNRHNIGIEGRIGLYEFEKTSLFSSLFLHEFWDSKNSITGTYASIGLGANLKMNSEKQLNGLYLMFYPIYDYCFFNTPKKIKQINDWNFSFELGYSIAEIPFPINIYTRYIFSVNNNKIEFVPDFGLSIGIYKNKLFGKH